MTVEELAEKRKEVEEWLDEKIFGFTVLGKEFNPTGKERYWSCPRCINVHTSDKSMHLYHLEELADMAQMTRSYSYEKYDDTKYMRIRVMYKGYEFFELKEVKK